MPKRPEPDDEEHDLSDAPDLLCTPESVKAFTKWVARAALEGRISIGQARDLNQVARTAQAQIRIDHGLNEMAELRSLVARMEAAVRERKQLEVGDRYAGTEVGEFEAEDGGGE